MTFAHDSTPDGTQPRPLKHHRQAAWRGRNPQSSWAHMALRSGLRRGLVTPEPCAHCGDAKVEAHHEDYDKPLEVLWVCRPCHKRLHASRRTA